MDERLHGHENPDESPDVLAAVDRRLDPLVPTGPAPVTDLLARGRARRTRRRGLQAGLAAAVAVAVAAVGSAVVADGRSTATPPVATQTPTAPDGLRTVGLDGLVVDVPADWVVRSDCGMPELDSLSFGPPEASACEGPGVTLTTSVQFPDVAYAEGAGPEYQHGLEVRRLDPCDPDGDGADACAALEPSVTFDFPDVNRDLTRPGQSVAARGPDREEIASSARPVPDGYTVVPDVVGLGLDEAKQTMTDAGLDVPHTEPNWIVGTTDPAAGSVVPVGTFVDLPPRQIGAVTPVPDGYQLVDFSGVAVAIPDTWTNCPMVATLSTGPGWGPREVRGCDGDATISLDFYLDAEFEAAPVTEQSGIRLQVVPGCPARWTGSCDDATHLSVRVVDQGMTVRIASPSADVRETALASIRAAD